MNQEEAKRLEYETGLQVGRWEIDELRAEVASLRVQCDALQRQSTAQTIELRALRRGQSTLTGQVSAFMHAFDQPIREKPGIPLKHAEVGRSWHPDERLIRLRAELLVEEVFEFVHACFLGKEERIKLLKAQAIDEIRTWTPNVSLPGIADACGDIDFVNEGARLTFGIDAGPVATEIYRSNMAKVGGPLHPTTGKKLKPPGWTPPDLEAVLKLQGWKPLGE